MRKPAGQTALALSRGPQRRAADKATVTSPGSAGPLISNITVFSLQYAVTIIGHAVSAPVPVAFRAGRRRYCAATRISTAAKMPGEGRQTNPWLLHSNGRTVAACES